MLEWAIPGATATEAGQPTMREATMFDPFEYRFYAEAEGEGEGEVPAEEGTGEGEGPMPMEPEGEGV